GSRRSAAPCLSGASCGPRRPGPWPTRPPANNSPRNGLKRRGRRREVARRSGGAKRRRGVRRIKPTARGRRARVLGVLHRALKVGRAAADETRGEFPAVSTTKEYR